MADTEFPFNLIIGVVGCTLKEFDGGRLRSAVGRALEGASRPFPSSSHTPVRPCILTCLSGDLDYLVVEEALARYPETRVRTVLPSTLADSLEELPSPEARQRFQELLALDPQPLALRATSLAEHYPAHLVHEARRLARTSAEKFVIDHSDVVISLDVPPPGEEPASLQYAREKKCPLYLIDPEANESVRVIPGEGCTADLLKRLDQFNQDLPAHPTSDPGSVEGLQRLLRDCPGLIRKDLADFITQHLIPLYTHADQRAIHFQRIYHRVGMAAYWLAFAAALLVGFGVTFLSSHPLVFLAEAMLLGTVSGLILFADRIGSHRNWMDFRFLAERLRAAYFLCLCGVAPRQRFVYRRADREMGLSGWTHLVVEELLTLAPATLEMDEEQCAALGRFIREGWVEDQIRFHEKRQRVNRRKGRLLEWLGAGVFYLALASALAHFLFHHAVEETRAAVLLDALTLAALALPALGATLGALRSHREYKRQERQSRQMADQLNSLLYSFEVLTPDKLKYLLSKLEAITLEETEGWLQLVGAVKLHAV